MGPFLNIVGNIDGEDYQDRNPDGPHLHDGLELGGDDGAQGETGNDQAVINSGPLLTLVMVEVVFAPGHDRFFNITAGEDVAVDEPLDLGKGGVLHC